MRLTGHLTCRGWGQKPKGRTTVKKKVYKKPYRGKKKQVETKAKCIFLMKFDTCARPEEKRVKFACLCHRSELWAEHGKCEKRICRKSNSNGEQWRERRGRGGERTKAAMNEKSAWRMQFWKCTRRVELTNWLNEWLDCLDYSDCRLPTVDWWLVTADWWNDWLLHWQSGQSLQQQRSWWNSCSLIRKSRSNCKKIHRKLWDTILSSERYATNVAIIQFY